MIAKFPYFLIGFILFRIILSLDYRDNPLRLSPKTLEPWHFVSFDLFYQLPVFCPRGDVLGALPGHIHYI